MRIVYHSMPDRLGRCRFTLLWRTDYHPGKPDGEHRTADRGQVLFADPRKHGFPLPQQGDVQP